MKNIKTTIKRTSLAILAVTAISFQGCNLDLDLQDRLVEESVWSDPNTAELYVSGMYGVFQKFQFGNFPNLGYNNAMDALADGMKFTSNTLGNGTVNTLISNANYFSPATVGLNFWNPGFVGIRRVNEMIEGVKTKSKLSEEQKLVYEAEGRYVRAYTYFWLAKLHGSLPVFRSLGDYSSKDKPRSSEQEVYDFMIEDLTFAAENLPKTNLSGRATKGAAYGMLSRVALYAGSIAKYDNKQFNTDALTGISQTKAKDYFGISASAATKVVELAGEGLYALDTDFAGIFRKKDTKEAIFRVDYLAPNITHDYDLGYAPPRDAAGNTLVYGVPTADLVDEFEMADGAKFSWSNPVHAANPYSNREPRFEATILHNNSVWKGRVLNTTEADAVEGFVEFGRSGDPKRTVTGYYAKKMLDPSNTTFVVNKSTQSWIEMRYAEIILVLAEAKAQLDDYASATTYINMLRSKRGLNSISVSGSTQAMQAIEHERKVELAFEGHRFWDLRRWRKAHIELNGKKMTGHKITGQGAGYTYEVVPADAVNRSFTGKLYYLPIPENEVQLNLALDQIFGW